MLTFYPMGFFFANSEKTFPGRQIGQNLIEYLSN